jgi:class 3 adenylate cyclase
MDADDHPPETAIDRAVVEELLRHRRAEQRLAVPDDAGLSVTDLVRSAHRQGASPADMLARALDRVTNHNENAGEATGGTDTEHGTFERTVKAIGRPLE